MRVHGVLAVIALILILISPAFGQGLEQAQIGCCGGAENYKFPPVALSEEIGQIAIEAEDVGVAVLTSDVHDNYYTGDSYNQRLIETDIIYEYLDTPLKQYLVIREQPGNYASVASVEHPVVYSPDRPERLDRIDRLDRAPRVTR